MMLGVSYFVTKALQNANDVISILLKELETLQSNLQKRDKELKKYQSKNEVLTDKTEEVNSDNQMIDFEIDKIPDGINEEETDPIDDDNEEAQNNSLLLIST